MLWALGLAFILGSIFFFSLNQRQRDTVLSRIVLRRRRTSGAFTPPLSPSLEKAEKPPPKERAPTNVPPAIDYKDVFPPSRRAPLETIATSLPPDQKRKLSVSISSPVVSRGSMIPLTSPIEDCISPAFTATELSNEEIEALGDFPDYAELSGVPLPEPCHEFDIKKALPRPYRPFRWSYHQTMSLTKMDTDYWLELENTYVERIAQRQQLYRDHGKNVLQYLPGSELACKELMEMSLQFLCARYPHYFSLSESKTTFINNILHTTTDLKAIHPLVVLLDNVPEDFAVMLRDPDNGFYYFRAGVICSSLGWDVGSKIGMQLHEIHAPIPDYKEKMQFSMDRYFAKLPTDRPIQRGSWGLEIDNPLWTPSWHPHLSLRNSQLPPSELPLSRLHLRVDWQTLRRLPLSGAIIFNFKALFTPIEEFRDEPYIPALCNKVLKEGKGSIMEYKGTWHVEHVVKPALEEWEREQVENGVVESGWEVRTLDESPWFPGWEEKWRGRQGF
ncbi:MAG: hypothetical protein M1835_007791 [Candelina submexicana]|nr:MAG: hypothetical protein M1835_007791 [Candelina submexicana]